MTDENEAPPRKFPQCATKNPRAGRPPGVRPRPGSEKPGRKTPHGAMRPHNITLHDADWRWCQEQEGGASEYLRRLIAQDRILNLIA